MTRREQIMTDMKIAMKDHAKEVLSTIRLLMAEMKQKEVDERVTLDDTQIEQIVSKMIKQRRDAIAQFIEGGRQELADKEQAEIAVLERYLPKQMSLDEIKAHIEDAKARLGITSMAQMGTLMQTLKTELAGKADMGAVSKCVREKLQNP